MKRKCFICLDQFEVLDTDKFTKYCSTKCRQKAYYLRNREKIYKRIKRWEKNNLEKSKAIHKKAFDKFRKNKPERFKELMKQSYLRNKYKWDSRNKTNLLIKKDKAYIFPLCLKCHSKEKLQIHHEIYPTLESEIIKAINERRIYYLCYECHKIITSRRKV